MQHAYNAQTHKMEVNCARTHTVHAHTHTRTHTHTRARTHGHTRARAHTHTQTTQHTPHRQVHTRAHTHTHSLTHSYTHTHARTYPIALAHVALGYLCACFGWARVRLRCPRVMGCLCWTALVRYFWEILEYLEMSATEFFDTVDKFRSPHLWKQVPLSALLHVAT
jgi:hypothetical protein